MCVLYPARCHGNRGPLPSFPSRKANNTHCIHCDGWQLPQIFDYISWKKWADELVEEGFISEKVEISDQEYALINTTIFDDCFRDTFVPEIARRRQIFSYWGPAFLIMNNCATHAGDDDEALAAANQIKPIWNHHTPPTSFQCSICPYSALQSEKSPV
jgi:hypothetical protein